MRIRRTTDDDSGAIGGEGSTAIDGVFILNVLNKIFVIFIMATTFIRPEKDLDVNLPEAKTGRPEASESKEIVINVLQDGRMKLGDNYFDIDGLVEHLKTVAHSNGDTPVQIRGDRDTVLQNAVRAMDACGRANLKHISVGLLDEGRGESRGHPTGGR